MICKKPALEINIISDVEMRQYARGELSPGDSKFAETVLLDDEQARALVIEEAPDENQALSANTLELLDKCAEACERAVICYEILSQKGKTKTVREYAAAQFSVRWKLLSDIRQTTHMIETESPAIDTTIIADNQSENQLAAVEQLDKALLAALKSVFNSEAPPGLKAGIADWIASIEREKDQITWLASHPKTDRISTRV